MFYDIFQAMLDLYSGIILLTKLFVSVIVATRSSILATRYSIVSRVEYRDSIESVNLHLHGTVAAEYRSHNLIIIRMKARLLT